jgi:hypothetical protein
MYWHRIFGFQDANFAFWQDVGAAKHIFLRDTIIM